MTKQDVTVAQGSNSVNFDNSPTGAMLAIADAKLFVPVVTILTQADNKLL